MIKDVFVVDASAHSYNLSDENHAAGRYSKAVVDAFYGAHHGLSPAGYRIPYEHYTRDWTLEETANMLFLESDYDFACHHVTPISAFKDGGCSVAKAREARTRWPDRFQVYAGSRRNFDFRTFWAVVRRLRRDVLGGRYIRVYGSEFFDTSALD